MKTVRLKSCSIFIPMPIQPKTVHQQSPEKLPASLRGMGVEVTDGNRESISGVGVDRFLQAEECPDHIGDLLLAGLPIADHSLLDLKRAVFIDWKPGIDSGQYGGASSLPQAQGALGVLCKKDIFDGQAFRPAFLDNAGELLVDELQACRESKPARDANDTVPDMAQPIAVTFHDTEARTPRSGIDSNAADHGLFTTVILNCLQNVGEIMRPR